MLAEFCQTTWHNIPEDRTLRDHHCDNNKSYIGKGLSEMNSRALQFLWFLHIFTVRQLESMKFYYCNVTKHYHVFICVGSRIDV
jgi:hypothetical protein